MWSQCLYVEEDNIERRVFPCFLNFFYEVDLGNSFSYSLFNVLHKEKVKCIFKYKSQICDDF